MKLLLDTHALLWWWTDDARLSTIARAAIADETNDIWVSAASAWEIAAKQDRNRAEAAGALHGARSLAPATAWRRRVRAQNYLDTAPLQRA